MCLYTADDRYDYRGFRLIHDVNLQIRDFLSVDYACPSTGFLSYLGVYQEDPTLTAMLRDVSLIMWWTFVSGYSVIAVRRAIEKRVDSCQVHFVRPDKLILSQNWT